MWCVSNPNTHMTLVGLDIFFLGLCVDFCAYMCCYQQSFRHKEMSYVQKTISLFANWCYLYFMFL